MSQQQADMSVHDVLVAGYPLIERGWVPKAAAGFDDRYCMVGAVDAVLRPADAPKTFSRFIPGLGFRAVTALAEATGETVPTTLGRWQDAQTKERVLEVWRIAMAVTAPEPDLSGLDFDLILTPRGELVAVGSTDKDADPSGLGVSTIGVSDGTYEG